MFLSVDWDFFIWNGMQAKDPYIVLPDGQRIPALYLFDWGHSEAHSPMLQEIMWASRFVAFHKNGLRMEDVAGIRPDIGCVDPAEFLRILHERFEIDNPITEVGDSHAWAGLNVQERFIVQSGDPVEVVLFDAHHDLGYDTEQVEHEAEQGEWDCASWLYHQLNQGYASSALIVYPDWRGLVEWEDMKDLAHIKNLGDQVRATTWSEWLKSGRGGRVDFVNLCRSSSWTPPYLDHRFAEFAAGFGDMTCMDCSGRQHKIGGHDSCQPRPWDRRALEEYAGNFQEMMK